MSKNKNYLSGKEIRAIAKENKKIDARNKISLLEAFLRASIYLTAKFFYIDNFYKKSRAAKVYK